MKETVSLSNQKVLFKKPVFIEHFQTNVFCEKLANEMLSGIEIIDDDGCSIHQVSETIDIKLMRALQTPKGIGVVIYLKSPILNGTYFYLQGDNFITLIVDPNIQKVMQSIAGYIIPV